MKRSSETGSRLTGALTGALTSEAIAKPSEQEISEQTKITSNE